MNKLKIMIITMDKNVGQSVIISHKFFGKIPTKWALALVRESWLLTITLEAILWESLKKMLLNDYLYLIF